MGGTIDLLSPYAQSFTFDETEKALQGIFIDMFTQVFTEQIEDIHFYGMPHLGSPKVVERFTKQDGLVMLRRQSTRDLIMRVIYSDWRSLASRRGLAFLEFVLQMVWTDQWTIDRMYHSIPRKNEYPFLAMAEETQQSFLTSRILILMDETIDIEELAELAPSLRRLVPAHIVPLIAIKLEIEDQNIDVGAGVVPYMVGNFHYYPRRANVTYWSAWKLQSMEVIGSHAEFVAIKTKNTLVYVGTANIDLAPLVLNSFSDSDTQQSTMFIDVVNQFTGTTEWTLQAEDALISYEATVIPEVPPEEPEVPPEETEVPAEEPEVPPEETEEPEVPPETTETRTLSFEELRDAMVAAVLSEDAEINAPSKVYFQAIAESLALTDIATELDANKVLGTL